MLMSKHIVSEKLLPRLLSHLQDKKQGDGNNSKNLLVDVTAQGETPPNVLISRNYGQCSILLVHVVYPFFSRAKRALPW